MSTVKNIENKLSHLRDLEIGYIVFTAVHNT